MRSKLYIAAVMIGFSFFSCKKEDVKQKENIESEVIGETWRIIKFIDSGDDETSSFTGFSFIFHPDGKLTATNSSVTYTGSWSVTDSNSNDDSPDDLHFNIYFNLSNHFEDLNDDWEIVSHTTSFLELRDVSGGNGGIDQLVFASN